MAQMTLAEIAQCLNVSEDFAQRLVTDGQLTFDHQTVMTFKESRDAERRQALAEMTAEAQRMGFYD